MIRILIIILFVSSLFSDFVTPTNGEAFNFRHILFQWEQEKDVQLYNIVGYDDNLEIFNVLDSSLALIVKEFDWENHYLIKLRTIDINGEYSEWIDSLDIEIMSLPNNWDTPNVFINNDGYMPGYTIIKERIIDRNGDIIFFWPRDQDNGTLFCITELLDNGQILAFFGEGAGDGNGIRADLKGHIYWRSPERVLRELLSLNLNNELHYYSLAKEFFNNNLPEWSGQSGYEEAGIDSILWFSDQIFIWNELNEVIWNWSSREHYSDEDVDSSFFLYSGLDGNNPNPNDRFDWTHSNALYFDYEDTAMYISSRHLSRITKIKYPSGEIEWNLGKDLPSSDPVIGENINISGQHAVRRLDNGNIMVYDNGNFKTPELSRGLEISINDSFITEVAWDYTLVDSLFTHKHGDCDRLKNGNSLITPGAERTLVEVDSLNNIVWAATVDTQYRSERIPGLYPLAFSVIIPNYDDSISDTHTVYLPLGNTNFIFTIHNEGDIDYHFNYTILDELGWFDSVSTVNINSQNNLSISIPGVTEEINTSNQLSLKVCPVSINDVECKDFIIDIMPCSTIDPNDFDSGYCPVFIYGDINFDNIVDILDIMLLLEYILEYVEYNSFADLNDDNIINISDVILLVNIILNS